MIRVNLLPPEHRPTQGTPLGHFVAIVLGVLLVVGAGCFWGWTRFVRLRDARDMQALREAEVASKEQLKARSLQLQAEIEEFAQRRRAIQTINRSRILWSRKLDQFYDLLAHRDAPYQAWLDELEIPAQASTVRKGAAKAKEADGGRFRFDGLLAMSHRNEAPAQNSLLYRALTGEGGGVGAEFFSDFLHISNPSVDIVEGASGEQLVPPVAAAFRYELRLKPREVGDRPKAPAAAGRTAPGKQ